MKTIYLHLIVCVLFFSWFDSKAQNLVDVEVFYQDSIKIETKMEYKSSILFEKIAILDSSGMVILLPTQIKSYQFNKRKFISVIVSKSEDLKASVSFFIEQLASGAVELYSYKGKQFGGKEVYLFRKKGEKVFLLVDKNFTKEKQIDMYTYEQSVSNGGIGLVMITPVKFNDEGPLLRYFANYFSDCLLIKNKCKQDLYNVHTLEQMFEDYNNCFKK